VYYVIARVYKQEIVTASSEAMTSERRVLLMKVSGGRRTLPSLMDRFNTAVPVIGARTWQDWSRCPKGIQTWCVIRVLIELGYPPPCACVGTLNWNTLRGCVS
jgi:hypothetical protein